MRRKLTYNQALNWALRKMARDANIQMSALRGDLLRGLVPHTAGQHRQGSAPQSPMTGIGGKYHGKATGTSSAPIAQVSVMDTSTATPALRNESDPPPQSNPLIPGAHTMTTTYDDQARYSELLQMIETLRRERNTPNTDSNVMTELLRRNSALKRERESVNDFMRVVRRALTEFGWVLTPNGAANPPPAWGSNERIRGRDDDLKWPAQLDRHSHNSYLSMQPPPRDRHEELVAAYFGRPIATAPDVALSLLNQANTGMTEQRRQELVEGLMAPWAT